MLIIVERWPTKIWVQIIIGAMTLLFAGGYLVLATDILSGIHRTGLGYTSKSWRNSETLQAIKNLPEGTPLISNEPMPILLYYDIWPHELSELSERTPAATLLRYGLGTDPSQVIFREKGGVLILYNSIQSQLEDIYGHRSSSRFDSMVDGLEIISQYQDGWLYTYP
jgi:hypothetical protein